MPARGHRPTPRGRPSDYKTYAVDIPAGTHWQPVPCEAVDCEVQAAGWVTAVDETTQLGRRQAAYIRHQSGRPHTETRGPGGATVFTFAPGTQCFTTHRERIDRPELYIVRGGDWRASTGIIRRHVSGVEWREDFAEHQATIADQIEKG